MHKLPEKKDIKSVLSIVRKYIEMLQEKSAEKKINEHHAVGRERDETKQHRHNGTATIFCRKDARS